MPIMKQKGLILALFFIGLAASDSHLKLVQVVFRHGIRAPIMYYPNAIHNKSFWNGYIDNIKNVSNSQMQDLAIYLKKLYPQINELSNVVVKSTNTPRTIQSANDTMKELFGESMNHTLIILDKNAYPDNFDLINCTELAKLKIESRNSTEYHKFIEKNIETINKLTNNSNINKILSPKIMPKKYSSLNLELYKMWIIGDMSIIERDLDIPSPNWVKESMNDLIEFYKYSMKLDFSYKNAANIIAGPLLYELIDNINSTTTTQNQTNFYLYSFHDSYIMALLNLINPNYELELPSWASALIFELHERSNDYYLKLYYKNTGNTSHTVLIDGCQEECALSQFYKVILTKIARNRDSICFTNSKQSIADMDTVQTSITDETKLTIVIVICGITLTFAGIIALIMIFAHFRRNRIKLSTSNRR